MASETEDDKLERQEDEQQGQDEQPRQDESQQDQDDHGDGGAEGLHEDDASITDEEREAIRASRREERRARKDRAREREQTYVRQISSLSRQNQDLALRLAQLEKRQVGVDIARVDGALESAAGEAEYWKQQIAVNAARGAEGAQDLADAQEKFYVSRRRAEDLARLKQSAAQRAQAPAPMDPGVIGAAQRWAAKNKWYDLQGRDPDSRVVLALDDQLASDGFDPRTPEYWEELDDRVKKYLPHRYGRGGDGNGRRQPGVSSGSETRYNNGGDVARSPVSGSEREVRGSNGSAEYPLSKERVDALKEAGLWEDPKARARMIARYREADKQQRQG